MISTSSSSHRRMLFDSCLVRRSSSSDEPPARSRPSLTRLSSWCRAFISAASEKRAPILVRPVYIYPDALPILEYSQAPGLCLDALVNNSVDHHLLPKLAESSWKRRLGCCHRDRIDWYTARPRFFVCVAGHSSGDFTEYLVKPGGD